MPNPSIRMFITVYKNTRFLKKVLDSVATQTYKKFKVSVLEDGCSTEMAEFIKNCKYDFQIDHFTQEDKGFRKNRIMNVGIRNADEELFVFIDGDCVLHPTFLKTYASNYDENYVLFAKRTDLDKKTSELLLNSERIVPGKIEMILNGSTRVEDSFRLPFKPIFETDNPRLLGCNMAIPRKVMLTINGFDEDFEITGYGEDCDIEWRMLKAGVKFKNFKFHSVQFHLYHERHEREEQTAQSRAMYHQKMKDGFVQCKNGLEKL
jgi:glycosyltransferase involved in cell wall biosynthesis